MQTLDTVFRKELETLLKARITSLKDQLAYGNHHEYQFRFLQGCISGLELAERELMDEANEKAQQRNR